MYEIDEQEEKIVIRVKATKELCMENIRVELVGRNKLLVSRANASRRSSPRQTTLPESAESTDAERPDGTRASEHDSDSASSAADTEPAEPVCEPIILPSNLDLGTMTSKLEKDELTIEIRMAEDHAASVRSITRDDLLKYRNLARLEDSVDRKRRRVENLCNSVQDERQSMREAELRLVKAKLQNRNERRRINLDPEENSMEVFKST
mmetsp:Transcript_24889/g.59121  ORF Transcript_24889/g.59121 Transcript_24889/m.59121 type:complete len:208 (-) Transcript_24889:87-710(-)|eukprot:390395-Rhodomonas_salina.2